VVEQASEPRGGRLDDEAVRSVPWTLLSYIGNRGIGFVASIVLARLLLPSDFGLIALANTTMLLMSWLRDLGLAATIISRPDLTREEQGTVLTMMVATSVVIALVGVALAPLIASLFDASRLTAIVRVLALTVSLGGFAGFAEAQLQKHLQFKKRFVGQLVQAISYAAVAIVLAAAGVGVWSQVAGQVAMMTIGTGAMAWLAAPYWVRLRWNRDEARDILRTSSGFLAQVLLYFLQQNTDYVVVGKFLSTAQVGFYYTAYRFAELPFLAVSDPVARVTFAAFSGMRARGERIEEAYLSVLRLVTVVSCPLGVLLSGLADPFVRVVLGDKWVPMITVLAVHGVWSTIRPFQNTASWLLNSSGGPGMLARINAYMYVALAAGLVVAAKESGIVAVAWVVVGFTTLSLVAIVIASQRLVDVSPRQQLRSAGPALAACVPTWGASYGLAQVFADTPGLALVAGTAAGLTAYFVTLCAIDVDILKQSYAQIRRTMGR
jgi:lipopolysaccharide exporter